MTLANIAAKTGVLLVVEGMREFQSELTKARGLLDKFSKSADSTEKSFRPLNKAVGAFLESLRRITEFVVAGLIIKGIEKITTAVRNMVDTMVDAGAEFQALQIRLEGLIAQEVMDEGKVTAFTEALDLAVPIAKDLFFWVQQLALQTPFDIRDVADTVTMAKAYGFTVKESKRLTESIIDFASGMGLTDIQMRRIIENFGQMIQQGKVTGTELRDLGRGAFLPVNKLLDMMRQNLGLTSEEFSKLRKKGELEVLPFIDAFIQMVGTEFPGAGERASRTIRAVAQNLGDLIQGVAGFNIVKPILDVFADRMAGLLDALTEGERGDRLLQLAERIGKSLSGMLGDFLGGMPAGETIADFILKKLDLVADRLEMLRNLFGAMREGQVGPIAGIKGVLTILGFPADFMDIVDVILEKLFAARDTLLTIIAGFREGGLVGGLTTIGAPPAIIGFVEKIQWALENIAIFWENNKGRILPIIDDILGSLLQTGEIAGETFLEILGDQIARFSENLVISGPKITAILGNIASFLRNDFLPVFREVADWVVRNQDKIINFLINFRIGLSLLGGFLKAFGAAAAILIGAVMGIAAVIISWVPKITQFLLLLALGLDNIVIAIWRGVGGIVNGLKNMIGQLWDIGYNAAMAFRNAFIWVWDWFVADIWGRFMNFINLIKYWLGIRSESKVFRKIGLNTMEGYAAGIMKGLKLPETAMKMAVTHTIMPATAMMQAAPAMVNNTTNNLSMTVNSSAQTENIIAGFRQLQSLAAAEGL